MKGTSPTYPRVETAVWNLSRNITTGRFEETLSAKAEAVNLRSKTTWDEDYIDYCQFILDRKWHILRDCAAENLKGVMFNLETIERYVAQKRAIHREDEKRTSRLSREAETQYASEELGELNE